MLFNYENFTSNTTAVYLTAVILLLSIYYFMRSRNLPPGPIGLPYIGYWPFFDTSTVHVQLEKLSRRYGEVFSFTAFGQLYISLSSFNVVREVTIKKSQYFDSRPQGFSLLALFFDGAFTFDWGDRWKVMRKFYVQQFKELGLITFKEDKNGPIYEAVRGCVKDIEKAGKEPQDITEIIVKGSNKILRTTLFAEEEDATEEMINLVNQNYAVMLEHMNGPNLILFGEFARYVIHPFTSGKQQAMEHYKSMTETMYSLIKKHKLSFNENNPRDDIIDRFLKERSEKLTSNDPTAQYFTDKALMGTVFQFIGDGVLTVAVFTCAILSVLLEYPEEQEKIHNELLEVVGADRDPGLEDKSNLKYTNAFILEVIRTCEVFPFIPSLECTSETTILGYRVPKGTMMLVNSYAANLDPNEFEEPYKFNPSRYISEKGKKKPEAPLLFGVGKRSCIGEGYAMAQAFLFLVTTVKHFHLTKPTSTNNQLKPFLAGNLEVCAHPRSRL